MLPQGRPMKNYQSKIDPRQMSFQGLLDDANDHIMQDSNKRVATMAVALSEKLIERENTLLFHTLTTDQLRLLAQQVHIEMERRGLI